MIIIKISDFVTKAAMQKLVLGLGVVSVVSVALVLTVKANASKAMEFTGEAVDNAVEVQEQTTETTVATTTTVKRTEFNENAVTYVFSLNTTTHTTVNTTVATTTDTDESVVTTQNVIIKAADMEKMRESTSRETSTESEKTKSKETSVTTAKESTSSKETTAASTTSTKTEPKYYYKPSTHYIHKQGCRWVDYTCLEITDTNGIKCLKCTECNPEIEIVEPYEQAGQTESNNSDSSGEVDKSNLTWVKTFSRGTYYAYGRDMRGGSGRALICGNANSTDIKGSIASRYLYNNYGYNYNGNRTKIYLEIHGFPQMNGYYYLDDCNGADLNVIDFYYTYNSQCPFDGIGVVTVDCWLVEN